MDDREITEDKIEVTLRYLRYHDPENATRENAIALLTDLRDGYHSKAHTNPVELLELQKQLDESNKKEDSASQNMA